MSEKKVAKAYYESFEEWKEDVNRAIAVICGLTGDDLPDVDYRSMFDDGSSPEEAAAVALDEAGWLD